MTTSKSALLVASAALIFQSQAFAQQQGPTVNNTIGNINNNQGIITQGQQGNNTIIQNGPIRAPFTDQLKAELLQKISKGTNIRLHTVGGNADQAIGNEVEAFLRQNGYMVERSIVVMMTSPPDAPYTMKINDGQADIFVAPSALR